MISYGHRAWLARHSLSRVLSALAIIVTLCASNSKAASIFSASSSNPSLVPAAAVSVTGSGTNTVITITPTADLGGTANITLFVSEDGGPLVQLSLESPLRVLGQSLLTLQVNGSGTITPNLGGQNLQVGATYTITALPSAGYAFSGWTGGLTADTPELTFVMRSNLVLIANFVDATRPFVAVTSPAANSSVTNSTVLLQGTASDNSGVAQVLYQVNGGLFQVAVGTLNWSASVALVSGANTVNVKSVDIFGNESVLVSHSLNYAVRAPISVTVNGNGTVSPNLNGQWLDIGRAYTVTATPAAGFGFTNWTGSLSAGTAQLTFVMQSNLTLVANFFDNTKPLVSITSPSANLRITNNVIALAGTASDNVAVGQVLFRVGGAAFQTASGTTTWTASANLAAGVNAVEVKSVDTSGNESLLATRWVTNVVVAPFALTINGHGTVTPNLDGQLLEIGRSYTLTAQPAAGYAFTNWSGGVSGNTPQFTFLMQSGLSLAANFIDVTKPTVAVASPAPNAVVTNSSITVQGTASDNASVDRVQYRLNGGPFQNASGALNWVASLSLVPGTNTLAVKSIDMSGNESALVSHTIVYVVRAPISVTVNGNGTVSPNLNGQWLDIGRAYTVTATPAAGFGFTNWTGSLSASTAQLTFVMQSNLTLVANFFDNTKPLVSITSPSANLRITNNVIALAGTASDNVEVGQVLFRVGGAAFQTASGTTAWTASANLAAGVNAVEVKSVDTAGNESLLATRWVTNVVVAPFSLTINGYGTVTPNLDGQLLEIGRSYTLTAQPAAGYAFTNWSGGVSGNTPQLTFVMQSGLSLAANFIDVAKPTVAVISPAANSSVSSNHITLSGTASDNGTIARVMYQINNGPFEQAIGTLSWSADIILPTRNNTIHVKSIDAFGNESALVSHPLIYSSKTSVKISKRGNGTITPDLDGQLLEEGVSYSIAAAPATGYTFTDWSGTVTSTNRQIAFVATTNVSLTANFADTGKPVVAITSPASNGRITNNVIAVTGTASDNALVAQVLYRAAGGPFQSVNGTTNWSITVPLNAGENQFEFKSVDTSGNESPIARRSITNVVGAPLTMHTNGCGTVSPNLHGQWLEIGKPYTVTAQPAAGHAFADWTGGVSTNAARITFVMQSNLVLVARFVDVTKPAVSIVSPVANSRLTNNTVTLQGRATDNCRVTEVRYQINNGPLQTATGTTNWSASLTLPAGPNTIRVVAVDENGLESPPLSHVLNYVVVLPIATAANGKGTVTPAIGQYLEVGKVYTASAAPGAGWMLTNWSGSIATNRTSFSFVMQSNLALTANFVDVTKPTVAVTAPAANSRVTNNLITLTGRATDNGRVAQVLYSVNDGPFEVATGTTNWSAGLTLRAGPNTIRVKSIDAPGHESALLSHVLTYVVVLPISMTVNGSGSVTPVNGQYLELGKTYTASARPGTGWMLTNWSGSIATNRASFSFVMQSNVALTATFVDIAKPTVTIATPAAGARLTNGVTTMTGRATDNREIAQVLYSLNDGPFQVATGTTNWSASLHLLPGPNAIRVKAIDTTGLESAILSRRVTYVVMAPISMAVNGRGTATPPNGQWLEIGKTYTASATPAAGFGLTNWTGSIVTNRASFSFVMQSNLTLTANFVDVTKPTVSVLSPATNARLTNNVVTLHGKASDNLAVAQVLYGLNDGPLQPALGTTNWSATLTLAAGPNKIRVKAIDVTGLESATLTQTVTYVVMWPISVSTTGSGSVTPNLNGQLLEIGKTYTMTATPAVGHIFSNWVGSVVSESAALSFAMRSNLTLTATFVPNPFLTVKGDYYGLFYEADGVLHESSGFLKVSVTDRGSFSGSLIAAGTTYPISGQFNAGGRLRRTIARAGLPSVYLDLTLDLAGGSQQVTGTVSDGSWVASYLGDRSLYNPTNHPLQGKYSILLPGAAGDSTLPAGHGHGAVMVDKAGNILLNGRSADGQTLSQAVPVSRTGEWPLYVPLYTGKGSILSWVTFTDNADERLTGMLSWIKPRLTTTPHYQSGFTNELLVTGSGYVPSATNRVVAINEALVIVEDGNLPEPITNRVWLTWANTIWNTNNTANFSMTLDRNNGLFSGTFRIPGTSQTRSFHGTLLTNRNAGFGYFLGTNQSGQVRFEAAPQLFEK